VVRETLRPHPSFTAINRIATQDDILPPAQPITDSNEKVHNQIPCHQGINLSLLEVNTDKLLWAPDAGGFHPDRWLNVPNNAPRVYSNLMT
ncbi:hypothetical protein F5879DRAFT_804198, partial [Lentinula edodes]